MKILDLITDAGTGQLSQTKIGSLVGYVTLASAFIIDACAGGLTDVKLLAFGAIMIGNATASKFISLKYAGAGNVKPDTTI